MRTNLSLHVLSRAGTKVGRALRERERGGRVVVAVVVGGREEYHEERGDVRGMAPKRRYHHLELVELELGSHRRDQKEKRASNPRSSLLLRGMGGLDGHCEGDRGRREGGVISWACWCAWLEEQAQSRSGPSILF